MRTRKYVQFSENGGVKHARRFSMEEERIYFDCKFEIDLSLQIFVFRKI